jgi:hypothetical protein
MYIFPAVYDGYGGVLIQAGTIEATEETEKRIENGGSNVEELF